MTWYDYLCTVKAKSKKTERDFIRKTVTIPSELEEFSGEQTAKPEHAGNFSSYVRSLILRDQRQIEKKAA